MPAPVASPAGRSTSTTILPKQVLRFPAPKVALCRLVARAASIVLLSTLALFGNHSGCGVLAPRGRLSVSTLPNDVGLRMGISCGDPFSYWLRGPRETRRRTRISAYSKVLSPFDTTPRGDAPVILLRLRPLPARVPTRFSSRSPRLLSRCPQSLLVPRPRHQHHNAATDDHHQQVWAPRCRGLAHDYWGAG
jgi:hypothetical protein